MSRWYVIIADVEDGPISSERLKEMAANGVITPDSMIRNESKTEWSQAKNVKGLSFMQSREHEGISPPIPRQVPPTPPESKVNGLARPPAAKASLKVFLVETAYISLVTGVVCLVLFYPQRDRFDGDIAPGAMANAIERLEAKVVTIFAFCIAMLFFRAFQKARDRNR